MDDNGHGTHCAGTVGGFGDDGLGLVGVNWRVSLMAVKFLDKAGSGSLANAIKAIDYARLNKAKIMQFINDDTLTLQTWPAQKMALRTGEDLEH